MYSSPCDWCHSDLFGHEHSCAFVLEMEETWAERQMNLLDAPTTPYVSKRLKSAETAPSGLPF